MLCSLDIAAARFPHAGVIAVPILDHPFDHLDDVVPRVAADACTVFVEQVDRVDELAVDVQLQLIDRGVADPHRLGAAIPAQVVEFDLLGTHKGNFRGLPATGREFKCRTLAIFEFKASTDRIICERVYFDSATILRQLGVAHDPLTLSGRVATLLNHPVTIGGASYDVRSFAERALNDEPVKIWVLVRA